MPDLTFPFAPCGATLTPPDADGPPEEETRPAPRSLPATRRARAGPRPADDQDDEPEEEERKRPRSRKDDRAGLRRVGLGLLVLFVATAAGLLLGLFAMV